MDWLRDTRELSLTARGLWIDVLCYMLNEPERGIYKRSMRDACRALGCSEGELVMAVKELGKVADVTLSNDSVTLISRRMVKEDRLYKMNANRVSRYRMKRKCNEGVMRKKLEVRSHKEKEEEEERESTGGNAPTLLPAPAVTPLEKIQKVFPRATPRQEPTDTEWQEGADFFGRAKAQFRKHTP